MICPFMMWESSPRECRRDCALWESNFVSTEEGDKDEGKCSFKPGPVEIKITTEEENGETQDK